MKTHYIPLKFSFFLRRYTLIGVYLPQCPLHKTHTHAPVAMTMEVKVLFFASIRELAGVKDATFALEEGSTTAHLKEQILAQFPQLRSALDTITMAVNKAYVLHAVPLKSGDEVALLPPISGG